MKISKFLRLGKHDFIKGLLVAIGTAALTALLNIVNTGQLPRTWPELKPVAIASISAVLTYLLKNLVTNSQGQIGKEPPAEG